MSDPIFKQTHDSALVEVLSGICRYLPNTLTVSLLVLGLFLGKVSWIVIACGAIVMILLINTMQFRSDISFMRTLPGGAAVAACSVIPSSATEFLTTPSLWMAVVFFYMTIIIQNAVNVYVTKPTAVKTEALSVQHRKAVGIVSIVTTVILLLCLIAPRFIWSGCESTLGAVMGGLMGIAVGGFWWYMLDLCGPDVFPDIHGVMIGLRPKPFRLVGQ